MVVSMNSTKIILGLMLVLLFASIVFPFNINNFLYPNENLGMVSYENFTQDSVFYSIIKISGKETILLKAGTEMTNETEITSVLRLYYKSKYYPAQAELNNLINLLKAYNESRYDGEGKEEYFCMNSVLKVDGKTIVEGKPLLCIDNATCEFASKLLYGKLYSSAFKDWQAYQAVMRPFANASYETDIILQTAVAKLETATEDTMYDALSYINASMPKLKQYRLNMDNSSLRSPNKGEKCNAPECLGLCPPIDLNETILNDIDWRVNLLVNKLYPFAKYKNISNYIASSTTARLDFYIGKNKANYYNSIFEPLREQAESDIQKANELSKLIVNASLKLKIELLIQLEDQINKSITNMNFTTIEADIEEYQNMLNNTEASIKSTASVYNQSLNASRNVNARIIIMESTEIGGDDALLLQDLINKTKQLNKKLEATYITVNDHASILSNYSEIDNALNEIEQRQRENLLATVMNNFKLATYKSGNRLFDAAKSANLVSEKDLSSNKTYIIGGLSLLTFLSLSAIVALVTSIRLIRKNITTLRMVMYAVGSLAVIVLFLIFSILLYYYLDKATTTTDIHVWLNGFWNSDKNLSIILNIKNVSENNTNSMRDCALLVSSTFKEHALTGSNKSVSFYEFADNCSIGLGTNVFNTTFNKTQCLKIMSNDEILFFDYSPNETTTKFPSIIEKYIMVSGDMSAYKNCAIAKIMVSE